MSSGPDEHVADDGAAALTAEVEGYLLAHSHYREARREADTLCARLSWLTTAQADDVARHYVRQRMDLTRKMLEITAHRAGQLRQEYEQRYAALRQKLLKRHAAGACVTLAIATVVNGLVSLLCR
ncbi:hypothetical protein [Streptomyces sp. NPDC058847]|uniref:hypothetical protein n=1 Tax=Streptomyces sp. NPDC058847 TaxID=3346649 RepID=UPI0036ACDC14